MDIILGKERKRWSEERKREIVAEAFRPGETVTGVARRHGANASMVFGWRRRLLTQQRSSEMQAPAFMPVALAAPHPEARPPRLVQEAPAIDVEFVCGARLRVVGAVDAELVAHIVKALKRP